MTFKLVPNIYQFSGSRDTVATRICHADANTDKDADNNGIHTETNINLSSLVRGHTVDSRYLEIEGTFKNSSRYPYFDISDL